MLSAETLKICCQKKMVINEVILLTKQFKRKEIVHKETGV